MELTVLGRYGPYPRAGGACSGYLVRQGSTGILIDCGAGVFARLIESMPLSGLDAVVLSHLHYDHCSDMSVLRYALEQLGAREDVTLPLPVYAPDGPALQLQMLDEAVFDVRPIADGQCVQIGALTLTFHAMRHPVPTFGMRVEGGGHSLFYTGDTGYFETLPALCRGADALLADACFVDADDTGNPLVHMTARQVGTLAKRAGIPKVWLTHLWGGADTAARVQKEADMPGAIVVEERGKYSLN